MLTDQDIPRNGRLLAVDFGESRIGLALTDELQITAQAFKTIFIRQTLKEGVREIAEVCKEKEVKGIILGNPVLMSGIAGEMTERTKKFADQLRAKIKTPITFFDERLTSLQAERHLKDIGKKNLKSKGEVDRLAAAFILRSFLDCR